MSVYKENRETHVRYNPDMEKGIFIEPDNAFAVISRNWKSWAAQFPAGTKMVVGISGGVDSTCVAALACRLFGPENVVGVSLPCDGQKDMADVDAVFEHLKIRRVTIDIGDALSALKNGIENNAVGLTGQCVTNMPARLRMTALFGVAQCLGGVVVNTCNLSEDIVGYSTFGGDNMGCYAPIKNLVKAEVMDLAAWLGVPEKLARKVPADGLQPLTDEQKFGFPYAELDAFIRCPTAVEDGLTKPETAEKIRRMYAANRFKLEIINIPGPDFGFASDVFRAGVYS